MHHIEIIFDILLSVITQPSIDSSQSLLYDVLIAVADDIHINEQLCAPINISKTLTASVDDQPQQSALSYNIMRSH